MRCTLLPFIILLLAIARFAHADISTPFIENVKLQQTSTGNVWIIATNPEQTTFNVLVLSDRHQPYLIEAVADKNIIPANILGKLATITATVTKQTDGLTTQIKILEAKPVEPPAPPKAKPPA